MGPTLDRRNVLRGCGALAIVSLAGCLGDDDETDDQTDDLPEHAEYIVEHEDQVELAYATQEAFDEITGMDQEDDADAQALLDPDDTLLWASLITVGAATAAGGLRLSNAGIDELLEEDDRDDWETTVDEIIGINDTTVLSGDIDTGEIGDELEATPEDERLALEFEVAEESDGFTIYEPVEDGLDDLFALSEDYIVTSDERGHFDAVLDHLQAEREPLASEMEELEWALKETGQADLVLAGYSGEVDADGGQDDEAEVGDEGDQAHSSTEIDEANAFTVATTLDGEEMDIEMAATWEEELTDEAAEEIDADFGSHADDRSMDIEGDRVTASGMYEEATILSVMNGSRE